MGLVKTIYNVLGGFYSDYNIMFSKISVHKHDKKLNLFLFMLYSTFSPIHHFSPINYTMNHQIMPQTLDDQSFPSLIRGLHMHLKQSDVPQ